MNEIEMRKYTIEELQQELDRREEREKNIPLPAVINNPDFTKVKEICKHFIDTCDEDGIVIDANFNTYQHILGQEVLIAMYGESIFNWFYKDRSFTNRRESTDTRRFNWKSYKTKLNKEID